MNLVITFLRLMPKFNLSFSLSHLFLMTLKILTLHVMIMDHRCMKNGSVLSMHK